MATEDAALGDGATKASAEVILVTGATGTVGRAIKELVDIDDGIRGCRGWVFVGSADADLSNFTACNELFDKIRPTHVLHLAAVLKGRHEMAKLKADIFSINIDINQNVLRCAHRYGVKKLVSCLSSTTYPAGNLVDVTEAELHNGPPAEAVSGYAQSKRMLDFMTRCMREQHGVKFVTVCPTNIFGSTATLRADGPLFEANVAKCLAAKRSSEPYLVWGTGEPRRQLLYSKDLARLLVWALENYDEAETLNLTGDEVSVREVVEAIAAACKFDGKIEYMTDKPDGPKRVAISNAKLNRICPDVKYTPFKEAAEEVVREHLS